MDADYDENSQITLNENRGKKKSSFSKALHTAKPTFDPGKDITSCVYIFNSFISNMNIHSRSWYFSLDVFQTYCRLYKR